MTEQSHLGPTCDKRTPPRDHIWQTTEHGHDICVDCKTTRPTPPEHWTTKLARGAGYQ